MAVLSRELSSIQSLFTEDVELMKEAETLSQAIAEMTNKKISTDLTLTRSNRSSINPGNLSTEITSIETQITETSTVSLNQNKDKSLKKKLNLRYTGSDSGPFLIIVESKSNNNIGNIHPMNLGKKLINSGITGIKNIAKKGKNRLAIEFISGSTANQFIGSNPFLKENDTDVYIPSRMVTCKGVISNVGSEITEEDLIKRAESRVQILEARQLRRRVAKDGKVEYVPSNSWVLTFQGRNLPEYIGLWGCARRINLFIGPVVQCYNCLRYGHTKINCSGSKRCRNCAGPHEEADCILSNTPKCVFCEDFVFQML
ncbi:hypothetical protein WA026_002181 [Henosepilachna vigintioctopunctata]|uniref:CCHC-type domain-containing protein n=1 Tax=Henosepilachna vigintioctopunctata TaxID=420089 RepID=A0AAW1TYQ6_9CUCU